MADNAATAPPPAADVADLVAQLRRGPASEPAARSAVAPDNVVPLF
jgi:hypothetical protein